MRGTKMYSQIKHKKSMNQVSVETNIIKLIERLYTKKKYFKLRKCVRTHLAKISQTICFKYTSW